MNRRTISHDHFVFAIVFPKDLRRTTLFIFETAVEIRDVVETAIVTYLHDRHGAVDEFASGESEPRIDDVIGNGPARSQFEESAESRRRHARHIGEFAKPNRLPVILGDELLDLVHATRIARCPLVGERGAGEFVIVFIDGQFIQDFEDADDPIETRLRMGYVIEFAVQPHDGRHLECHTGFSPFEQFFERSHLVFAEERVVDQIGSELDGDFPDAGMGAPISFPRMFEAAPDQSQVIIAEHFHRVPDDAPCILAVLYEIQFVFGMPMQRVIEFAFVTVDQIEAILRRKRGNLRDDFIHGGGFVANIAKFPSPQYFFSIGLQNRQQPIGRPYP